MKWSEVAQLCPTLCHPMDFSLPGFSVHLIFQARVLEWVAISFSRGSFWHRDRTRVSRIVGRCFTLWAVLFKSANAPFPPLYLEPGLDFAQRSVLLIFHFGNSYSTLTLEKARGTRDQIANICWIIKKAREFQKIIYFCFIDYVKAFDCVDHNKLWKILKEMGILDHLTCLLRNLYSSGSNS